MEPEYPPIDKENGNPVTPSPVPKRVIMLPRAAGFNELLRVPSWLRTEAWPVELANRAGAASTTFAVICGI